MFAKTFRNTLIASGVLVGAFLIAGPAALAQVTDGGEVGGNIAPINTLSFTDPTAAASTPLTTGNFQMGALDIRNNDPQGWTLQVKSTNGGRLQNTDATAPATVYVTYSDLTVAGTLGATPTPVTPTTVDQVLVDAPYTEAVSAGATGLVVSATIASTGVVGASPAVAFASLPTGTYTDTITFTLTSK